MRSRDQRGRRRPCVHCRNRRNCYRESVPDRVSPARRGAFQTLLRVEAEDSFASDTIHADSQFAVMSERDRALAQEITLGCLRWQGAIDAMLAEVARRPVGRLDREVRIALRMGCYQMRFLDRIPDRAAVSESVELVKTSGKRSAAGFVNAVLRTLPRRAGEKVELERTHPRWLVDRWTECFDEETVAGILKANQTPPSTYLRLNTQYPLEEALQQLHQEGVETGATELLHARLLVRGKPMMTVCWRDGRVRIQDLSSQMIVPLLNLSREHRFLDLCAAPGGKTVQAVEAIGSSSRTVAADRHLHRLRTLGQLAATPVKKVALDATAPLPFRTKFDRILVDVPCSGTGTLARNPEIKWRLRPQDLRDLVLKQKSILTCALGALEPSGVLVYSTCSLEPEENRGVVQAVLDERTGFRADAYLERVPGRDPGDGFFACRIVRLRDS